MKGVACFKKSFFKKPKLGRFSSTLYIDRRDDGDSPIIDQPQPPSSRDPPPTPRWATVERMATPHVRIGHGYDLHRLEPIAPIGTGKPFTLGGVAIDHDRGPVAHSDGDVLFHAVTDALLGAIGAPDIGQLFPNTDAAFKDANSEAFLAAATQRVAEAGLTLGNLDATIVCERPAVGPHRTAIIANLARVLGVDKDCLNIKAKTHEGCDAIGRGEAIEVHAVVLLQA